MAGPIIAFQGEPAAYSEAATFDLCGGDVSTSPLGSFELCFKAVAEDRADFAMLPIENTRGGTIIDNVDLQLRYNLFVCAEFNFRVRHCLMALPGTSKNDIKALAQCDIFLRKHGYTPEKEYDTAGSAKRISQDKLKSYGAIASSLAAKQYGLQILEEGIEDDSSNTTRFLLLSKQCFVSSSWNETRGLKTIQTDMKTSIVFSVNNVAGSLFKALGVFALRGVTLTKLDSRPDGFRKAGTYLLPQMHCSELYLGISKNPAMVSGEASVIFYIDLTGSICDAPIANAIKNLVEVVTFLRILGCYPKDGRLQPQVSKRFNVMRQRVDAPLAQRRLKIGIVGFGNFGQFLAKTFVRHGIVSACSKSDYTSIAEAMGVRYFHDVTSMLEQAGGLDVLVISVAILAFDAVVALLPVELLSNVLVVDVLSVKVFPKIILSEKLPVETAVLCTHPMFGPESGKYSWKGLTMVYEEVRMTTVSTSDGVFTMNEVVDKYLGIFVAESCCMVEMSCETHDRQAADSQFITHFIGRTIAKLRLAPTLIATKGFKALLTLRDNTMKDSFDLFSALYLYNTNSRTSLENIRSAVSALANDLERINDNSLNKF